MVGVFEMVVGNGDGTIAAGGAFGVGGGGGTFGACGGRSFSTGPPPAVLSDAGFADPLCDADDAPGVALDDIAGIAGSPCDAAEAVGGGLPCGAARAVTPDPSSGNIGCAGAVDAAGSPGSSCDVCG